MNGHSQEVIEFQKCPHCDGTGMTDGRSHSPRCSGSSCAPECPIPVQELCERCDGGEIQIYEEEADGTPDIQT